jgi:cell division protein ZapA (FtsZ GTPase activity inhibitor)
MAKTAAGTTKVAVMLHGREYMVACGAGEEKKLQTIVEMVDSKLNEAGNKGGNVTETHTFMLACLMLADELIEIKRTKSHMLRAEEDLMVAAVDHLRNRVATIAQHVGVGRA